MFSRLDLRITVRALAFIWLRPEFPAVNRSGVFQPSPCRFWNFSRRLVELHLKCRFK
jgi:hypothetical protein